MPDPSATDHPVDPDLPFEEALTRLEALIQGMESDQVPLDDLIRNYEAGTALYRVCEKRLDEAQGRVEFIRKKHDGAAVAEPFGDKEESAEEMGPPSVTSGEESDHEFADGELF